MRHMTFVNVIEVLQQLLGRRRVHTADERREMHKARMVGWMMCIVITVGRAGLHAYGAMNMLKRLRRCYRKRVDLD